MVAIVVTSVVSVGVTAAQETTLCNSACRNMYSAASHKKKKKEQSNDKEASNVTAHIYKHRPLLIWPVLVQSYYSNQLIPVV